MKRTILVILLLTLKTYSQDLSGTWKIVSYEDKFMYYDKSKDSIFYKVPEKKVEIDNFKVVVNLTFFLTTYSFENNGKFIENHSTFGQKVKQFEIDEVNKQIILIDSKKKKEKLPFSYHNGLLLIEKKIEIGRVKIGLKQIDDN